MLYYYAPLYNDRLTRWGISVHEKLTDGKKSNDKLPQSLRRLHYILHHNASCNRCLLFKRTILFQTKAFITQSTFKILWQLDNVKIVLMNVLPEFASFTKIVDSMSKLNRKGKVIKTRTKTGMCPPPLLIFFCETCMLTPEVAPSCVVQSRSFLYLVSHLDCLSG